MNSHKSRKNIRPYVEAALFVALGLLLSGITLYRAPMGGSVTPGSTVPVCLVSLRSGVKIGVLAGLNFGILSFLTGGVLIGPGPFLFDYILAYMSLGVFGFLRNRPFLSVFLAQFLRLACHFISGVLFFSQGKDLYSAASYSLVYNLSFLLPDAILGMLLFSSFLRRAPELIESKS